MQPTSQAPGLKKQPAPVILPLLYPPLQGAARQGAVPQSAPIKYGKEPAAGWVYVFNSSLTRAWAPPGHLGTSDFISILPSFPPPPTRPTKAPYSKNQYGGVFFFFFSREEGREPQVEEG